MLHTRLEHHGVANDREDTLLMDGPHTPLYVPRRFDLGLNYVRREGHIHESLEREAHPHATDEENAYDTI